MNNSVYPYWLKTFLKATPSFAVFCLFTTLFCTVTYDVIYHPKDRIERYYFRSNRFEKLVRRRDEKLRIYYKPALEWQPTDQEIISLRPLQRF